MREHGKKFTRYAMVGVANTLLYISLLWMFLELDLFSYPVSVALAFGIAICFHYLANKHFTFESD
ncbi:MAG: GtrA family protein, partial [Pseudomonadota bacterium]